MKTMLLPNLEITARALKRALNCIVSTSGYRFITSGYRCITVRFVLKSVFIYNYVFKQNSCSLKCYKPEKFLINEARFVILLPPEKNISYSTIGNICSGSTGT